MLEHSYENPKIQFTNLISLKLKNSKAFEIFQALIYCTVSKLAIYWNCPKYTLSKPSNNFNHVETKTAWIWQHFTGCPKTKLSNQIISLILDTLYYSVYYCVGWFVSMVDGAKCKLYRVNHIKMSLLMVQGKFEKWIFLMFHPVEVNSKLLI